jgi:hypothetical protein
MTLWCPRREGALLRLILRGMRQLALVILNPNQIPRIDPAVARLASEKMISLADVSPIRAFTFRYALTPMECGTFANRGDVLESSVAQVRLLVPPTSSFSVNVRFARSGRS